jgi:superfamily I DNA/RNA helicase|tara:strand:+ start:660 stop:2177 length:1518 start_codon:yes stop_codon:yes gene_type:complete
MHIVLGPPGTGKTTKLLSLVEQYLGSGVPPDRIGYFAFTRRASQEAVERACSKFNLSKKDLPFFRTLHSLAFLQAGLTHSQVITSEKYQEIAGWLKIGKFYGAGLTDQGPYKDFGYGDKFLEIINIARIMRQPLRKIYNDSIVPLKTDWARVDYVSRGIEHWKSQYELYDYTGMLELFLQRDLCPRLEVVFIDEAQDLSPIQWEMVRRLESNSRVCYVAGDDDQAIYRWAGADVDKFVNLEGKITLLDQSYRIPSSHHSLSHNVIKRIVGRREKIFQPREEEGKVVWHRHSEEVNLSEGDWLLLSRTTRGAQQIEEEVRRRGHLYLYNGSKSIDSGVLEAVRLWEFLREGNKVTRDQVLLIYKQMLLNTQIRYGCKTMPDGEDGVFYSLTELQQYHGLLHNQPWDIGLGKINDKDKTYIKACLRKGESLTETPRLRISTIHSAKGAQATNVMLLTDTMRRPYSMWRKIRTFEEDETRVFYVGLTRATNNIHLVHPMHSQGYSIPS